MNVQNFFIIKTYLEDNLVLVFQQNKLEKIIEFVQEVKVNLHTRIRTIKYSKKIIFRNFNSFSFQKMLTLKRLVDK